MAVKKLTQNQRIFAIVTVSVLLVYAFVNLGLAINGFVKLSNNIESLEDYAQNWQSSIITNLTVTSGNCPTGFVTAFTDRSWPGTSSGCWCGNLSDRMRESNNITCDPFCSSSCSGRASTLGCKDVAGKEGKQYNYISNIMSGTSSVKAQVCIKRSAETLASNSALGSSGSCPSGYTKCGSGDYIFCTKETVCPITSIQSGTVSQSSKTTDCLSTNGCHIISDDGVTDPTTITFKRSNDVNDYPLTQITLNENAMCNTIDESNKTPGRSLFYLLNKRPSGCGNEGDSKWNRTFTTNEKVLFANNDISVSIFINYPDPGRGLAGYYRPGLDGSTYQYGLFNRGYLPWAPKCRDRLQKLVMNIDKVSQTKTAQTALLVVGVLSAGALGIVLSVMELMNLAGKDLSCFDGKDEEERAKIRRTKMIINYCFKGLQLPFQIWAIAICAAIKGYFADIAKDECSNTEVNATLSYFAATFQSTYSSNISSIVITLAFLLFDLFTNFRKKKSDNKTAVSPQAISPSDEQAGLNLVSQRKEIDDQNSQNVSPAYPVNNNNKNNIISPSSVQPQSPPANIQVNVQGGFQLTHQEQPQPQYVQQQYIPQQQASPQQQPQPQYVQQQYIPQQQALPQQQPQPQPQYVQQQYISQQQVLPQQQPQPQYVQQQAPPQQFAAPQYPPQQYPYQYPPQQHPGQPYPQQYPPQQYPNPYPPQQVPVEEAEKKDDHDPTAKFGKGQYY